MILLDTNVISELMRPRPEPRVQTWIGHQLATEFFISAVTEAELRYGVAVLPDGRRRQRLETALSGMLDEDFAGRILPFDSAAATVYATIAAERRRAGRPISQMDAQIAAIARSRGASLATRNHADFQGCGISVLDPWTADRNP
jgi:predicted nucleic acid-binding protein